METASHDRRKSHLDKGVIYFWTATINSWNHLLEKDAYKDIIIDSLCHLSEAGKIEVFAFVIMPNHLHLVWREKEANGKESPHASLLKFTAHAFEQKLRQEEPLRLEAYRVEAANKRYEFWQRDALAIPLFTRKVAAQKLDYLHNNPVRKHWRLVKDPLDYRYSSLRYYRRGEKDFSFLKNLWDEIG